MSEMVRLSQHEQQKLISFVGGLPPADFLYACDKEHQRERWQQVKSVYSGVGKKLKAYFSGEGDPGENLPPLDEEYYSLLRDKYLKFYQLIQYAWNRGLAAELSDFLAAKKHPPLSTPGETLLTVLEQECIFLMSPAFEPYLRWTPHQARNEKKLVREGDKLLNLQRQLTAPERKKVSAYLGHVDKRKDELLRWEWLILFCLDACYGLRRRHNGLKRYWREYMEVISEMTAFFNRVALHSRSGIKGYEWRHGECIEMSRYGGKPST